MMKEGVLGLVLALILAGCLANAPTAIPTPPPVPAGWIVVEKGGLRIALPPDWPILEDQDDVLVSVTRNGGDPNVFLLAQAPSRALPQPDVPYRSEDLETWILHQISSKPPDQSTRSEVRLPAGPAVLVRFHFDGDPGSFEAVDGVAYAITTPSGVAYLQVNMSASLVEEFAHEMAEVPMHLTVVGAAE